MILKTYTRIFTTDPERSVALIAALHGTGPHLEFAYGDWTLTGIGDVLVVGGSEEALAPIRGSLGPWIVEDIDETRRTLTEAGSEIVRDVTDVPTGRMMYARHADGSVVEYVEWTDDPVERLVSEPLRRGVLSSQI